MSNISIFDIILLALFILPVLRGWRRGVLSMLIKALGWGAAAFLIVGYSAAWAEVVYHAVAEQFVITLVTNAIPADAVAVMNSGAATIADVQSMLDGFSGFSGFFGGLTIDISSMDALSSFLGQGVDELASGLTQTVLQPVLIAALKIILSVFILIACLFVFGTLSRMLGRKKEGKTVLGKTNKILGSVVGALMGSAMVYIYCMFLSALADMPKIGWVTPEMLANTGIVSRFIG